MTSRAAWPRRRVKLGAVIAPLMLAVAGPACGPLAKRAAAPIAGAPAGDTRVVSGRPPVVIVAREGDARGAIAMAVTTEGVAPEREAEVPVALAAMLEGRLGARATVTPSGSGVRVRGLVADDAEATTLAGAMVTAALAPVAEADVERAQRKVNALARTKRADATLAEDAWCSDAVRAPAAARAVDAATLETWRRAALGLGRVALAAAGSASADEAAARAIARGPSWPAGAPIEARATATSGVVVYDATGDVPARGARVTIAMRVASAERAVAAAEKLGDPKGALASRLGGLDAPARVDEVTATAHATGACLRATIELTPRELAVDAAARIATATALARQEITGELAETPADPSLRVALARREGDPRDAAEVAAWWALAPNAAAEARDAAAPAPSSIAIGVAAGRDAPPNDPGPTPREADVRAAIDRAIVAWHEPVVEARTRVERGQGETWILLASPCGTRAEVESDAGLGATVAIAAAARASEALRAGGGHAEAWATPDGIGVVVHGPALAGEAPEAQARRLADAVARTFAAEPMDRAAVARARARLVDEGNQTDARSLVVLAEALAPGHPSWVAPGGSLDALGRTSDDAVSARASALRAGPLRVAVLANDGAPQTDVAVRAVDRWIARHAGASRACAVPSVLSDPHPGTYAVEMTGASEAWIAAPIRANDDAARASAEWTAAILDGKDGLLAHALGGGLARSWAARVVGSARASALVVRVDAPGPSLDAAVAQVRALLDRLRRGSIGEADRARAISDRAAADLAASLDPRARLVDLWRQAPLAPPPPLETLKAFAAMNLKDDALVIAAARPPRARATAP